MARKVLVTGGAGFIGSNLVDALLDRGDRVVVLDDLSTGYRANVADEVELHEADIADADAVAAAAKGCEVIFHLAAHRAVQRSVDAPIPTDRANVGGTLAVLEAARTNGVRRVVSSSSSSVYGGAETMPTPETVELRPRSPYAVSKLAGEHYARVYAELFGVETVSLRYFNVYGPRQRPDGAYALVIPLFVDALRKGVPPEVHGDGLQSRDFTYVDDAVRANLLAADAPAEGCSGRAFNVAGGAVYNLLQILDLLGQLLHVKPNPVHTASRPGDVRHTSADLTAVKAALGYEPSITFPEGLARSVAWLTR